MTVGLAGCGGTSKDNKTSEGDKKTDLTNQAMIGEYLRMFISYGVVTLALVLHAWKRQKDKEMDREYLGQEFNNAK